MTNFASSLRESGLGNRAPLTTDGGYSNTNFRGGSAMRRWPQQNNISNVTETPSVFRDRQSRAAYTPHHSMSNSVNFALGIPESAASRNENRRHTTDTHGVPLRYNAPSYPVRKLSNSRINHGRQERCIDNIPTEVQVGRYDLDIESDTGDDHSECDTSSGKKGRSCKWPPLSDPHIRMTKPDMFGTKTIGETGRQSGRNLLAIFHNSDGTPRTRYSLRVIRGRARTYLPAVAHYPPCSAEIPGDLSLEEICCFYPRHVWGTGLRLFIAENWTGQRVYNALPEDFKTSSAAERPWNYLQQGFTREVDRMNQESGYPVEKGAKRKRAAMEASGSQDTGYNEHHPIADSRNMSTANPSSDVVLVPPLLFEQPHLKRQRQSTLEAPQIQSPATPIEDGPLGKILRMQECQLLEIMRVCRRDYSFESPIERLERARHERIEICRKYGLDFQNLSLLQQVDLVQELQKVVEHFSECTPLETVSSLTRNRPTHFDHARPMLVGADRYSIDSMPFDDGVL